MLPREGRTVVGATGFSAWRRKFVGPGSGAFLEADGATGGLTSLTGGLPGGGAGTEFVSRSGAGTIGGVVLLASGGVLGAGTGVGSGGVRDSLPVEGFRPSSGVYAGSLAGTLSTT